METFCARKRVTVCIPARGIKNDPFKHPSMHLETVTHTHTHTHIDTPTYKQLNKHIQYLLQIVHLQYMPLPCYIWLQCFENQHPKPYYKLRMLRKPSDSVKQI